MYCAWWKTCIFRMRLKKKIHRMNSSKRINHLQVYRPTLNKPISHTFTHFTHTHTGEGQIVHTLRHEEHEEMFHTDSLKAHISFHVIDIETIPRF